jgi:hypothetical protein
MGSAEKSWRLMQWGLSISTMHFTHSFRRIGERRSKCDIEIESFPYFTGHISCIMTFIFENYVFFLSIVEFWVIDT